MPIPGLTDVDVQIATDEMRRRAESAAATKDWRTYSQNRDAIVLSFTSGGYVRIPMSRMVLEDLRRVAHQNTGPRPLTGVPAVRVLIDDDPKKVAEFAAKPQAPQAPQAPKEPRTSWDWLLDEDPPSK